MDGDQAEAARRERIAEDRIDPRRRARRAARRLGQHQVARLGILQVRNRKLAPLLLVDRGQIEAIAFLADHAQHQLGRALELLHHMGDMALPRLLRAREDAVVQRQCGPPPTLDHAQPRRRRVGMPAFRLRQDLAVIDRDDPQHGHPRHPARLVEGAAGRAIDQPLVGHVLEQGLQHDLVMAREPERAGNLALSRGLSGGFDEVEDLLGGRQAGGRFAGHVVPNWARPWPPTMPRGGTADVRARRSPARWR